MNKDRQRAILEILMKQKSATVKELADTLYISEPSIRRDLAELEQQRMIKRVHGGAMLEEGGISALKISFAMRELECSEDKARIAKKAASLIHDGDVVFLDASSSAYSIVPFLTTKKNVTVITSGIKAMTKLAEYGIKVISTGGDVTSSVLSLVGNGARAAVRSYYADICFFSCRGLSLSGELSDISMEENYIRQEMIARSRTSYLLCAGNKIDKQFYHKLCDVQDITGIICSQPLGGRLQERVVYAEEEVL